MIAYNERSVNADMIQLDWFEVESWVGIWECVDEIFGVKVEVIADPERDEGGTFEKTGIESIGDFESSPFEVQVL